MQIEERAREVGRMIGQSSEYQAFKRANDAVGEDTVAVSMLQRLEALRAEAQRMLEQGERPTEEMERELDQLLGNVQTNASYQRLLVAQENFDKLMARVNQWMVEGIERGAASPIITLG
jgi:cell fate (sporulation/competence/biofilm development) regulator YlbF (YheA/YmcA/DUF963 family)